MYYIYMLNTHVETRNLLQVCKQVVTKLLLSRYQDVFASRVATVVVISLEQFISLL
jgi:hypothetical protein